AAAGDGLLPGDVVGLRPHVRKTAGVQALSAGAAELGPVLAPGGGGQQQRGEGQQGQAGSCHGWAFRPGRWEKVGCGTPPGGSNSYSMGCGGASEGNQPCASYSAAAASGPRSGSSS